MILSDTHGYLDEAILDHARQADEAWHAGDFGNESVADALAGVTRLRGVYGNVDGDKLRRRFPLYLPFVVEGLQVFITHIGGYPGRYSSGIKDMLRTRRSGLFISGHSHIVKVMRDPGLHQMIHINPGAAGKEGFHQVRTLARITVSNGTVSNLRIVELGTR